jgi:prepilin-type N-terminal cleavage/methylation domain-containing protein
MGAVRKIARSEDGFTIIEMLVAAVVLAVGVATMVTVFTAAGKLTQAAERQTAMAHRASLQLEQIKSLPWGEVALTGTSSQWSTNSSDYTYVSGLTGACPATSTGPAPLYQPDHSSGGSTNTESLVINGCSYTLNGSSTEVTGGTVAPVTSWSDGTYSGYIYTFITWVNDSTCSATTTPGSNCPTTNDYKRITIVVTITPPSGSTQFQPSHPAIVSEFLPNPNQNSQKNPIPSSDCTNSSGQVVSCDTVPQQPQQYFLCDSSYSNSSCSTTPSCSGNNLHQSLVNYLLSGVLTAPSPDLLGTSTPTGDCTDGGGNPTPPCYGLDVLTGCAGVPIVPTTPCTGSGCSSGSGSNGSGGCTSGFNDATCVSNSTCGTAPPSSNTKAHSWVTSGIPSGTNIDLSGSGSFTTYVESGSGVAVNATVCLGVYLVPGGILGSLTGNLLSDPIGVVVAANVTAEASVLTPVSFNFNLGTADAISGGGLLGLPRLEVVVWVAASGSTDVQLDYDQAYAASQITLETT